MKRILKFILLVLGWLLIAISIIDFSLLKNTDMSILLGGIGTAILFVQSIIEAKMDETVNKTIDIVTRKLSVLYFIVSIILFVLYFI